MTNEQINVAIAQACGWMDIEECTCGFKTRGNPPWYSAHKKHIPDYCTDLNAMHEAEQMLTEDQFKMYTHWLEKLMPNTEYRSLLCAPSSRRAEAFLRAMGKWEEVAK